MRYAAFQQIANFHHLHKIVDDQASKSETDVGLQIPVMIEDFSYTDEVDQWREGEYRIGISCHVRR